jgi:valyl-tRNA synthetase
MDNKIQFYPEKFKNTYSHWLTNIKDWCISRQLWWGHRIPAWYTPAGDVFIAKTAEEALSLATDKSLTINDLRQDEDVLDTWFSSWLWPISVFDGFQEKGKAELDYYYPTADLVTAPDIIFFWVARMVMAGHVFEGKLPFKNVYFTGIVRDKERKKMSKSLGNSPDPLELMEKYGTDGVRMGLMLSASAGNDILFDEALCEQGRNFCNKIWNSYRLIQGLETIQQRNEYYTEYGDLAHQWIQSRLSEVTTQVNKHFDAFRISDALMELFKLTRDDFSGWYLEIIKPTYGDPIPEQDLAQVKNVFDAILRLLHPFMPFITEELWQGIALREQTFINSQEWPVFDAVSTPIHPNVFELISEIRSKRNENGISPKVEATIFITTSKQNVYTGAEGIIQKLANVALFKEEQIDGFKSLVGTDEVTIAFKDFVQKIDVVALESEIKRLEGFLIGIDKKLTNESFMANAKGDVIAKEEQKKSDTLSKIASLKTQLG